MTNEELVDLIQRGVNASDNMGLLYQQNEKFIYSIANRLKFYEPIEDLMNEAYFGLHKAAQRYIPDKDTLFISYAAFWIKQQLIRHIETCCSNVRVPSHLRGKIRKYNNLVKAYQREHGRAPTDRELMATMGLSEDQLNDVKMAASIAVESSLDEKISEDDGDMTIMDTLGDDTDLESSVVDKLFNEQLKSDLWALIDGVCTEEEALILNKRFGECMTQKAIGETMGLTNENIRQREQKALTKLRRGSRSRSFREKYEIEISRAYKGSVGSFMRNWTSPTENAAINLYELERGLAR